jgi:hypothetical protein
VERRRSALLCRRWRSLSDLQHAERWFNAETSTRLTGDMGLRTRVAFMTSDRENMAHMRDVAIRECAPALDAVRENFQPSKPIEEIMIAAFIHGASWACANLMPEDAT